MNTPELTPRDIVENAIAKLMADSRVSPIDPMWMVFRGSLLKAFDLCDERLGNCLRSHKQAASEIRRLEGVVKELQAQLVVRNVEIAERKLAR